GVLQLAIGVLQLAIGVLQSAIGVLQLANGVLQFVIGVLQLAIGVLQSAALEEFLEIDSLLSPHYLSVGGILNTESMESTESTK
ncbi:MAG: hypothetical protein LBL62_08985, partial [Planctomycetaceae bacterium]|nr:hypothetical protein [Planctomycetaceae bacterium]